MHQPSARRTVAQSLKQRTATTHARVEACLGLLDPALSVARLGAVLARFAAFWGPTEAIVDDWAARDPAAAAALDWPRRRRTELLRADVRALGGTLGAVEEPALPVARMGEVDVLGWLYVSEGSTLGGAVIDRTLRRLPGQAVASLRSFTPYAEGPGPMWSAFLDYVEGWVRADDQRREALESAAVASFGALEAWLAPVAVEVSA